VKLNLDNLSEAELADLNHRIVARLRMLAELRAHASMLDFKIGERVCFETDANLVTGMLVRYNKKTVSLVTDDGHRWNVAPSLLRRAAQPVQANPAERKSPNIIAFRKD
jgi:hypothetical protein